MILIDRNSRARTVWDLTIVFLILAGSILIPYQVAFAQARIRALDLIIYAIDIFFLIDIYFNFHTTFRQHGIEIRERRRIAERYTRTMFPFDAVANFPFDLVLLAAGDMAVLNVSLVLVLRLTRLLRIVRLFHLFRNWEDKSWTNSGILRIGKYFIAISLITHWIACLWFFSSFVQGFPEGGWVARQGLVTAAATTQYIRSLYWTVVTMTTVGYGDITPVTGPEYLITIMVVILGASTYAFMIGSIASLITRIDGAKVDFRNKVESVSQYLRYSNVPYDLHEKVRNYYDYLWSQHRTLTQGSLLADLPVSLRLDVLSQVMKELLENVPLFRLSSPALQNELMMSLEPRIYAPEGLIVREGETGQEIFFLSRGEARIIAEGEESHHLALRHGDSFGEIAFLFGERRTASVQAVTYCEVFVLSRASFERIRSDYEEFSEVLKNISAQRTTKTEEMIMRGIII